MDVAARLPRIMGIYRGGKSLTKVKLRRTGKLNRTICRIGNFFGIKNVRDKTAVAGCSLFFVFFFFFWCKNVSLSHC